MDTRFNHKEREASIYKDWQDSGYFSPAKCLASGVADSTAKPFSIVLPPPNVTGTLHMGHAAMLVLEDIMVRYARLSGRPTLWIPGTDHAGIATQSKVEKDIYKESGQTRHDLGREKFLEVVADFVSASHSTISSQIKSLGASVDWQREAFTLDESRTYAVNEAFRRMYEAGLIYRGERIVNWDPKLGTTVSDDEIEYIEQKDPFYYFQYGPFVIGTVRPETKFGDKYVVMHPDDKRYKDYHHNQQIELEWINGPLTATVIKDESIDMEVGTGVMTITPAHSTVDFEIASRHGLDKEPVIDERGILLPIAGDFAGQHIKKARPAIVAKLKNKGLLVKTDEDYIHNIATNSRGGGVIEPQIKLQWFIDVNQEFKIPHSELEGIKTGDVVNLKQLMRHVVDSGQIEIIPNRFAKVYFNWIDNLRDWCISRQIWYGHQIPVWYKGDDIKVGEEPKDSGWIQDPDTLDTWFSSGLWTFSTLGWPKNTDDLKTYHPTSILETGYDILFFWIARMILMSTFLLGQVPFRQVYLHGLVRDAKGRKMSKSLGNGIDPLDMIDKYGADATRLSLVIGAGPGNDINLSEDKVRAYRNFSTKIWNAARFVLMNKPDNYNPDSITLSHEDKIYLQNFSDLKQAITKHYDNFEFNLAAEKVYNYFWNDFANGLLEELKPRLTSGDMYAFHLVFILLKDSLILLHPFIPFVTEEVYQKMKMDFPDLKWQDFLMVAKW